MAESKNLRTFFRDYRQAYPRDFVDVEQAIKADLEITSIAVQFEKAYKFPLLFFKDVTTFSGSRSAFPVAINVFGDRRKLAFAIGSTFENVSADWYRLANAPGAAPVTVSPDEAPIKECVTLGDAVDLRTLPALHQFPMDPGAYISAGMFTCYDPETWTDNCGLHRGYIAGPREIRVFLAANTHNLFNLQAHEQMNEPMKCAYWIGHHPSVLMGAHTKQGYPASHYQAASRVSGQPIRLVPSETLGDDFLVPADAEFVIEGVIRPNNRAHEGPFGEYPRYYGAQKMSPIMDVTAVTHRRDAIWDSFFSGVNNVYGGVHQEQAVYATVRKAVPQVTRVHCPISGAGLFHCYVQLRKTHNGQPRDAIMAVLSCPGARVKHVVVVDDDIDIFDDRWVLWAIATRSQWDRDLVVIPGCSGPPLDPSNFGEALTTKAGIDATKPAPPERYPITLTLPDEVIEQAPLGKFIDPSTLAAIPGMRDEG